MKFKTWKEAKFDILTYTLIPIVVGGAFGIPHRGWVQIGKFLDDNRQWGIATLVWLFMIGIIFLFAEAKTPKLLRVKRMVGGIVVTLWVWGAMFSGLYSNQQPPVIQRHIDPPAHWWKCGNS